MMEPTAVLHTATTLLGKSRASCRSSTQRPTISTERHTNLKMNSHQHPVTETKTPMVNCDEPAYVDVTENICKLWRRFLDVPHAVLLFLAGVLVRITFLIFGIGSLGEAQEEPTRRREVRYNSVKIPPHMCAPSVASSSNKATASPSDAVVPVRSHQTRIPRVTVNRPLNTFMPVQMRTKSVVRLNHRPTASPSDAVVPVRSHQTRMPRVKVNRPLNTFMPVQMRTKSVVRLNHRPTASPSYAVMSERSQQSMVPRVKVNRPLNTFMPVQLRTPSVVKLNHRPTAFPSNAVVPVRSHSSLVSPINKPSNLFMSSQLCTPLGLDSKLSQLRLPSVMRLDNRPPALPSKSVVPLKIQRTSVPHYDRILIWIITSINQRTKSFQDQKRRQVPISLTIPLEEFKFGHRRAHDAMKEDQSLALVCQPFAKDAVKTVKDLDLLSPLAPKDVTLSQKSSVPTTNKGSCLYNKELDVPAVLEIHSIKFTLTHPLAGLCEISARLCVVFRPECIVQVLCSTRNNKAIVKIMKRIGLPLPYRSLATFTSPNSSISTNKKQACSKPASSLPAKIVKEAANQCCPEMTVQKSLAKADQEDALSPDLSEPEMQTAAKNESLIQPAESISVVSQKETDDNELHAQKKTPRVQIALSSKDINNLEAAFSKLHEWKKSCSRQSALFRHHKPLGSQPLAREQQLDTLPFSRNQLFYYKKARQVRKLAARKGCNEVRTGHSLAFQNKRNKKISSHRDMTMAASPRVSKGPLQYRKISGDTDNTDTRTSGTRTMEIVSARNYCRAALSPPQPSKHQESSRRVAASYEKMSAVTPYKTTQNFLKVQNKKPILDIVKTADESTSVAFFNLGEQTRSEQGPSPSDANHDKLVQSPQVEPSVSGLLASCEGLAVALQRASLRAQCAAFSFAAETDEEQHIRPSLINKNGGKTAPEEEEAALDNSCGDSNSKPAVESKKPTGMQSSGERFSAVSKDSCSVSSASLPRKKKEQSASDGKRTGQAHCDPSEQMCTTKPKLTVQQTKENRLTSSTSSSKKNQDQSAKAKRTGQAHSVSSRQTCATMPKLNAQQTKENRVTSSTSSSAKKQDQSASKERTGKAYSVSSRQTCAAKPNLNTQQIKENRLTSSTSSLGKEEEQSASDEKTGQVHSVSSAEKTTDKPTLHVRETKEDNFTQFCKEYFRKAAGSKTVLSQPSFGLIEAVNRMAMANRRASLLKDGKPWRRKWSSKRRKRQKENKKIHKKCRTISHSARNMPRNTPKRDSLESVFGKNDTNKDNGIPKDAKGSKREGNKTSPLKEVGKALEVTSEILRMANSCIQEEITNLTESENTQEMKQQTQVQKFSVKPGGKTITKPVITATTRSQTLDAVGNQAQETEATNTGISSEAVHSVKPAQPRESVDKLLKKVERGESSYQAPSLEDIQEAAQNIKTMFSSLFVNDAQVPRAFHDGSHVNSVCSMQAPQDTNITCLQKQNPEEGNTTCLLEATTHKNTMLPVVDSTDKVNLRHRSKAAKNIDTVLPLAQETDQVNSVNQPQAKHVNTMAEESDHVKLITAPELGQNVKPTSLLVDGSDQASFVYKPEAEESTLALPLKTSIPRYSVSMSQGSPDTGNLEAELSDVYHIEGIGCHVDPISYLRFDVEHESTQDMSTSVAQDPVQMDSGIDPECQTSPETDETKIMVTESMNSHAAPVGGIGHAGQGPVMSDIDSKAQALPVTDEAKNMVQQCIDNHAAPMGEIQQGRVPSMPDMEISGQFNIRQSPSGLSFHVSGDVSTSDQNLLERIQVSGNIDVQQIQSAEGLKISTNLNIIPSISGEERIVFQNEVHGMDEECKQVQNKNTTMIQLDNVAVDSSTTEDILPQEQPVYVALIPYVREQYGQEYISTVAGPLEGDGQVPEYLEAYLLPLESGYAVLESTVEEISVKNEENHSDVQQTEEFKTAAKATVFAEAFPLPAVEECLEPRSASEGMSETDEQICQRKEEFQASNLSAPEVETAEKHPVDETQAGHLVSLEGTTAATGTTLLPSPASEDYKYKPTSREHIVNVSEDEVTALAPKTKTSKETRNAEKCKESLLRIKIPNGHSREVDKVVLSRAAELIEKGFFVLSDSGTVDAIVDPSRVTREGGCPNMCAFSRTFNHHDVLPTQLQQKIIKTAQDEGFNNRVSNAESTKPAFAKACDNKTVRGQIIQDHDGDQIMIDAPNTALSGTDSQMLSHFHPFMSNIASYCSTEPQGNVDIDMMSDESLMDIASGGNSQTSLMECKDYGDQVMGQYCHFCKELQRQKSLSPSLPFSQVQGQPQATLMSSCNGNNERGRVAMFGFGSNVQKAPEKQNPFHPTGNVNETSYIADENDHNLQAAVVPGCNGQTSFFNQPSTAEQPISSCKVQENDSQVSIFPSHPSTIQGVSAGQDVFTRVPQIVQGRGSTSENTDAPCSPQNEEAAHNYSDAETSAEHTDGTQENEGLSPVAPSILDLCASADITKLLHDESLPIVRNLDEREEHRKLNISAEIRTDIDNAGSLTGEHSGYDRSTSAATSQITGKSSKVDNAENLPKEDDRSGLARIGSAVTFLRKDAPSSHSSDCQGLQLVANGIRKKSESIVMLKVMASKDKTLPGKSFEEKWLPLSASESQVESISKKHLVPTIGLGQANEEGSNRRKVIVPRKRASLSSAERKVVAFEDLFGQDTRPGSHTASLSGKKRPRNATTEVHEPESSTELKRRRKVHFNDVVQVCMIDTLPSQSHPSVYFSVTKTAVPRKGILKNSKSRMAKG